MNLNLGFLSSSATFAVELFGGIGQIALSQLQFPIYKVGRISITCLVQN